MMMTGSASRSCRLAVAVAALCWVGLALLVPVATTAQSLTPSPGFNDYNNCFDAGITDEASCSEACATQYPASTLEGGICFCEDASGEVAFECAINEKGAQDACASVNRIHAATTCDTIGITTEAQCKAACSPYYRVGVFVNGLCKCAQRLDGSSVNCPNDEPEPFCDPPNSGDDNDSTTTTTTSSSSSSSASASASDTASTTASATTTTSRSASNSTEDDNGNGDDTEQNKAANHGNAAVIGVSVSAALLVVGAAVYIIFVRKRGGPGKTAGYGPQTNTFYNQDEDGLFARLGDNSFDGDYQDMDHATYA